MLVGDSNIAPAFEFLKNCSASLSRLLSSFNYLTHAFLFKIMFDWKVGMIPKVFLVSLIALGDLDVPPKTDVAVLP